MARCAGRLAAEPTTPSVRGPASRSGRRADASAEDVEEAVAAARRAFDATDWSTNHPLRLDLVKRLYEGLQAN